MILPEPVVLLRPYLATDWPRVCEIHDAARLDELRASKLEAALLSAYRNGIGRALLRHAIERSGGALSTEVLVGNDSALALYLAEGFSIAKRVDGRLSGNEAYPASGHVLERGAR